MKPDDAFHAAYGAGRPTVVARTLIADLETPVSAYLKIAHGRSHAFLLESVQGGETRGRYSVIGFDPDIVWRCRNGVATIDAGRGFAPDGDDDWAEDLDGRPDNLRKGRFSILPVQPGGYLAAPRPRYE